MRRRVWNAVKKPPDNMVGQRLAQLYCSFYVPTLAGWAMSVEDSAGNGRADFELSFSILKKDAQASGWQHPVQRG